jgi:hypothetical protein
VSALPPALGQAFRIAAAELGMYSAARLFLRELAAVGGDGLVREARDQLGRDYPVLDCLAERWLAGDQPCAGEAPGVAEVAAVLKGVTRLLIVGVEADHLDALVPRLAGVALGLISAGGGLEPDWHRVLANYGGRVEAVGLADLQRWAGRRSALLTFVYGTDGHTAHVNSTWLRVTGPDVRTQFRSLIGWDVLGAPMLVYPRWLVAAGHGDFSHLVAVPARPAPVGDEAR